MLELVTWSRNPWSIFDELESLEQDLNGTFAGRAGQRRHRGRRAYPLMNVWRSADGIVIDAEVPGADPKNLDVSVQGDQLTVNGKLNQTAPPEGEVYHRQERWSGDFARVLQLPFRADAAGVKANYSNGILRIAVPRSEDEQPKKIAVEAA